MVVTPNQSTHVRKRRLSMKFKTQHKAVTSYDSRGNRVIFRAHRDGASVWTTGDKVVSHTFETVKKAGEWMNCPSFSFID